MSNGYSTPFTLSGALVRTIHAALNKKPASDGGNLSSGRPTSGPCGLDEQRSRHMRQSGGAAQRDHTGIGGHTSAARGSNLSGRTAPRRPATAANGGSRCSGRPLSTRHQLAIEHRYSHVKVRPRQSALSPHGDRRPCDLRRAGDRSPRRSARTHQPLRTRQDQLRVNSATSALRVAEVRRCCCPQRAVARRPGRRCGRTPVRAVRRGTRCRGTDQVTPGFSLALAEVLVRRSATVSVSRREYRPAVQVPPRPGTPPSESDSHPARARAAVITRRFWAAARSADAAAAPSPVGEVVADGKGVRVLGAGDRSRIGSSAAN
jgi:hypothetical protein